MKGWTGTSPLWDFPSPRRKFISNRRSFGCFYDDVSLSKGLSQKRPVSATYSPPLLPFFYPTPCVWIRVVHELPPLGRHARTLEVAYRPTTLRHQDRL